MMTEEKGSIDYYKEKATQMVEEFDKKVERYKVLVDELTQLMPEIKAVQAQILSINEIGEDLFGESWTKFSSEVVS